jgi:hypothetical protein
LTHEQRGVVIVWGGKQNLFLTLRGDVHTGHYGVETTEFQAGDQAVERLVGEGTGGINLFTQRVCQIHIETDDFVVGVGRFKRRVACFGGETDSLRCGSRQADACKQRGDQYFFHCHFPENSVR